MPPLVYETVAWLRHYLCVPIAMLPGESELTPVQRNAYAAPIAGAVVGASGGLVLLVAALLHAPAFLAAALAVLTLVLVTCGRGEQALAASAEKLGRGAAPEEVPVGSRLLSYGLVAIVLSVLVRVGALDGLASLGAWPAALALVGAAAAARAATIAFHIIRPAATPDTEGAAPPVDTISLQWVAIVGIAIGIVTVFPFFGIGAAIAGLVGAIAAAAIMATFVSRAGESDTASAASDLVAETTFLIAVLAFATRV